MDESNWSKLFRGANAKMSWEVIAQRKGRIYCNSRNCWCLAVDWSTGACKNNQCFLDKPEYIKRQKEIDQRMQKNFEKHQKEKEEDSKLKTVIRYQKYTDKDQKLHEAKKLRHIAVIESRKGNHIKANKLEQKAKEIEYELEKK